LGEQAARVLQYSKEGSYFHTCAGSLNDAKPFYVEVDSSDFATGAVLSQQSEVDGKWHSVAFFSKFLFLVQQNYEIHNKETLEIICTLKK